MQSVKLFKARDALLKPFVRYSLKDSGTLKTFSRDREKIFFLSKVELKINPSQLRKSIQATKDNSQYETVPC